MEGKPQGVPNVQLGTDNRQLDNWETEIVGAMFGGLASA